MNAKEINNSVDLLDLIGGHFRGTSRWKSGPCPFCGGTDRFVLLHTTERWVWFCRGPACNDGKYHTVIDYVMRRDNCTFREAVEKLGGSDFTPEPAEPKRPYEYADAPLDHIWMTNAGKYVEWCRQQLYKPENKRSLAWLVETRKIAMHTLSWYKIGYNPVDRWDDGRAWGLDGKVFLQRGIILPHYGPYGITTLKVRLPVFEGQKYGQVKRPESARGSLFGWQNLTAKPCHVITFTEGELDCMYLSQATDDMGAVVTLGSCVADFARLFAHERAQVLEAKHILVAYDSDEAGANGALKMLERLPERARMLAVPEGTKDISEIEEPAAWWLDEFKRVGGLNETD